MNTNLRKYCSLLCLVCVMHFSAFFFFVCLLFSLEEREVNIRILCTNIRYITFIWDGGKCNNRIKLLKGFIFATSLMTERPSFCYTPVLQIPQWNDLQKYQINMMRCGNSIKFVWMNNMCVLIYKVEKIGLLI